MPAIVELCGSLAILNVCILPYWVQEGWGVVKLLFCDSLLLLNLWRVYQEMYSAKVWNSICIQVQFHTQLPCHTMYIYSCIEKWLLQHISKFCHFNSLHHTITFTLEQAVDGKLPCSYRHMHSFTPRMMVSIYKKRTLFSHHPHYVKKVWSLNCLFNQARTIS